MDPLAIHRMNDFYKMVERLGAMPEVLFIALPAGSGFADIAAIFGNVMSLELIASIRGALNAYENELIIKNKSNEQKSHPKDN